MTDIIIIMTSLTAAVQLSCSSRPIWRHYI